VGSRFKLIMQFESASSFQLPAPGSQLPAPSFTPRSRSNVEIGIQRITDPGARVPALLFEAGSW
jgi:hypothetical protein